MATPSYPTPIHNSHHFPEENYRYMEWGTENQTDSTPIPPPLYLSGQHYHHQDFYPTERHREDSRADYSQVAGIDYGFKKLKSNQIQILRELKREYEVLRNTELETGFVQSKKLATDRSQSYNDSSKSRSDGRSSSYSRIERTRRKSQHKEIQMASLQRKQMELMLNNSMKKIEQLLSSQIQLKKTILQLRNKLDSNQSSSEDQEAMVRKHREQVQSLKKFVEDHRREAEALKQKLNEKTNVVGTLEGEIAVNHIQLKKKDQRIKAFEEEIYLEKNKYCNIQLDLKKCRMEAQMMERSLREELSAFQRKFNSAEEAAQNARKEEIFKLKKEIELKDERYRILLAHKEQAETKLKEEQRNKDLKEEHDEINDLKREIQLLKHEKHQKTSHSEEVLSSILEKLAEMPVKQDQKLLAEVHSLRQELEQAQNQSQENRQMELNQRILELQKEISELEKNIEDENIEKMYFIEDIKKIKSQMTEQKRKKEEAEHDVRELKQALRKVEEEARKYSYQLQALRNVNLDLAETHQQNKNLMFKSQQVDIKELELAELKEDHSKIIEHHKSLINEYQNEIKNLKRKLAEEEVRAFKIKEEMELKLNLARTQFQAETGRLVTEMDRIKKNHALQMNERIREKTHLQGKLQERHRELQSITNQLNAFVKERDSVFQAYRTEQEKQVKNMQEESASKIDSLAKKIETLADLSNKHAELVHRSAMLEQDHIELKRALRHNRQINDGIDHLWSIKEAEYSNLNDILKSLD